MVIKNDRSRLSLLLKSFLDQKIDNSVLVDQFFFSEDMLVRELIYEIDFHINESTKHYCTDVFLKEIISRFIIILSSNFEFPKDYRPKVRVEGNLLKRIIMVFYDMMRANFYVVSALSENKFWPLVSEEEWNELSKM
jgi:hypothetical protein